MGADSRPNGAYNASEVTGELPDEPELATVDVGLIEQQQSGGDRAQLIGVVVAVAATRG
jgi:hypothetical protein